MKKTILFLIIIQFSVICSAQTFGPNVKLKQTNIFTITDIEVGINLDNAPCWAPHLEL